MIPNHLQSRYHFTEHEELCQRVSSVVDGNDELKLYDLMRTQKFLPAGNTLLAGWRPIRPNCCILPEATAANLGEICRRSQILWGHAVGIGFSLNGLTDPIAALHHLSGLNAAIKLGYRPQRGNMAALDIEHPQAERFLRVKSASPQDLYNFNLSVVVSDGFMRRVAQRDPPALRRFSALCRNAWETGDPGVIFLDRVRRFGGTARDSIPAPPDLPPVATVVPCGEQAMLQDEACNLGSINLAQFSLDSEEGLEELGGAVCRAVRALDRVVDLLDIPDAEVSERTRRMRRVGLGVMGLADALERLGLRYEDASAREMAERIAARVADAAEQTTGDLARESGGLDFAPWRRNATVTCIAPTGGITLLTSNKGFAIEPFFKQATRIPTRAHVLMQAAWQRHMENSISKTVNLPRQATEKDVADTFQIAFELDCKSVTVYREGCRKNQPIACTNC